MAKALNSSINLPIGKPPVFLFFLNPKPLVPQGVWGFDRFGAVFFGQNEAEINQTG
jgi:hypothetical protein